MEVPRRKAIRWQSARQLLLRWRSFCLSLRSFRVPVVYLTSAFLWFFSILLFRGINNLTYVESIPPEGFDSHPGHHSFLLKMNELWVSTRREAFRRPKVLRLSPEDLVPHFSVFSRNTKQRTLNCITLTDLAVRHFRSDE